jgi:Na+/melibiose symporter-like transporter
MTEDKQPEGRAEVSKESRIMSFKEMVLIGLPNLGLTAILGIAVSFTVLFYINIMGQPPIVAGGIYSAALFFYAAMCVLGGAIADKIGKKKVLLFSGPIVAISFIFVWTPPHPTTGFGIAFIPLIIFLVFFSFLFRLMVGFFQPTLYSLLPELSTDEQNRVKASMVNMLMMLVGTVIGAVGPILLLGDATQGLDREDPTLFIANSTIGQTIASQIILFSAVICIMFVVLFAIMMLGIKEPKKEKSEASFKDVMKNLAEPFKDKNARIWLVCFFLFWIPFVALQYSLLNIATFVLKLRGSEFPILALIVLGCALASFVVWDNLSKKQGLKKTLSICLAFSGVSFSLIFILVIPMEQGLLIVLGTIVLSLCLTGFVGTMIFPFTITADLIDQAELKTGKALSGAYSGAFTMMGSLASGVSMLIISSFLEILGAQNPLSFAVILMIGAVLLFVSIFVLRKVQLSGISLETK